MKPGVRALGVAESYAGTDGRGPSTASGPDSDPDPDLDPDPDPPTSTVCGAVVRADRVVDGLAFGGWTVGGTDATARLVALWDRLARPDVRYLLVAGVAPAWFNLLDLRGVHDAVDRPVIAVAFESSPGLEPALRAAFDGAALDARLATYEALPPRTRVSVGGGADDATRAVHVRAVGLPDDEAAAVVRAFTPDGAGGRPEPLRVARLGARAADAFRPRDGDDPRPDAGVDG
jgi:hypothetical protein